MAFTSVVVEGTTLTTAARNVKVLAFGAGSKRGGNHLIPYRDGEYSVNPKWYGPSNLLLELYLKGSPSHAQNLSTILSAFNQTYGTATITATHDYAGSVQAEVELLRDPVPTDNPYVYQFVLRNPKGVWEAVTATTSTGTSGTPAAITTSGDRPVDDFTVRFASTGYVEHTDANGTVARLTLTAGASTGVTVNLGNRTVLSTTGGNQDAYLTVTQPYWMRFEPGSTQALTATMNHTITWRSKWQV